MADNHPVQRNIPRHSVSLESLGDTSGSSFGAGARLAALGISAAALALGGTGPIASTPATNNIATSLVTPKSATLANLQKRISFQAEGARLEAVMETLGILTGQPIETLWESKETEGSSGSSPGLHRDLEITVSAKNLTFRSVLDALCRNRSFGELACSWQVLDDGTLQFGSKEDLNRYSEIKIYDVRDLLFRVRDFTNAPQLDLNQAMQQGKGGGGGSIFQNSSAPSTTDVPSKESMDELIRLLMDFVEPEQWKERGGNGASIQVFNGNLLIQAPGYIHRQLQN